MNSHKNIKTTVAALVLFSLSSASTIQASTVTRTAKAVGNSVLVIGGVTTAFLAFNNSREEDAFSNKVIRLCQVLASTYTALSGIDGIYNVIFNDIDEEIDPVDVDNFDNDILQ